MRWKRACYGAGTLFNQSSAQLHLVLCTQAEEHVCAAAGLWRLLTQVFQQTTRKCICDVIITNEKGTAARKKNILYRSSLSLCSSSSATVKV